MANQNDSIITIEAQPGQILLLGSSGSSQQTQIIFDLSGWKQQFIEDSTAQPDSKFGVITLTYMLGGPVVKSSATFFEKDYAGLEAADYKITWLVESDITNFPGAGVCQITYTNTEGTSFHTTVWQTIVTRSVLSGYGLTESEKDAYASWIIALQNSMAHLSGTKANVSTLSYGETAYVESSTDAAGFVTLNFYLPQAPQGKYINSLSWEEDEEDGYQFYYTLYDPSQDAQHQDSTKYVIAGSEDLSELLNGAVANAELAANSASSAASSASSAATNATTATNAANSATSANNNAIAKATEAAGSATTAQTNAELASRYARGKDLTGEDVSSGDGFQDNAKYYKELAASSASAALNSKNEAATSEANALNSKNNAAISATNATNAATNAASSAKAAQSWAVGGTNSRTGEDTNNAEYWSLQSLEASTHYPKISSQTGNWLFWDTTAEQGGYVDSGSLARGPKGDTGSAVNIKGQVATAGDIPSGAYNSGDGYFVGIASPYDLYIYYDNQWNNNGPLGGVTIQLDTNTHSIKFNV